MIPGYNETLPNSGAQDEYDDSDWKDGEVADKDGDSKEPSGLEIDHNHDGNVDNYWDDWGAIGEGGSGDGDHDGDDPGGGDAEDGHCGHDTSCLPTDLIHFWVEERFEYDEHKPIPLDPKYDVRLLAKAQPDECFNGVGEPIGTPPCNRDFPNSGIPKTNDAYVWGQANTGDAVWFGTVANTHCLVEAGFLGIAQPQVNPYWVCEFGQSTSGTGDFRPPNFFRYDLITHTLQPKNPPPASVANALRLATIGIRAAGTLGGVVFLAGPSALGGINVFAFDVGTGDLLAAANLQQFADIRTFLTVDGVLYAGVLNTDIPDAGAPGGSILRWTGTKSADPAELFQFEVVGEIREEAANLTTDGQRLFVTGWPTFESNADTRLAGLWRSPEFSGGGLTTADAKNWEQLFRIDQYDKDPLVASTTALGAVQYFDGKIYFGTMNVPFVGTFEALNLAGQGGLDLDCNGDGRLGPEELVSTALGTHRSISVFALPDPESDCHHVELLYGERYLPRYVPELKRYAISDTEFFQNGLSDPQPKWGASGLGNFFNAYTWSMAVHDHQLFIGTFDWSQLARVGLQELLGLDASTETLQSSAVRLAMDSLGSTIFPKEGADLFRIKEDACGAVAESLTGLGNDTNYGVRTMTTSPDDHELFVGTANPMNLNPRGGWELLELTKEQCGSTDATAAPLTP